MTPDELRLLTDPAARNDPAFAKRVRAGMRQQQRARVMRTLRITGIVLGLVGLGMLAASALTVVGAVASMLLPMLTGGGALPPSAFSPAMIAPIGVLAPALPLGIMGVVLVGVAAWVWVPSRGLLASGVRMPATVVQVLDIGSGMRIKGPGMYTTLSKATVLLRVTPPSAAPYEVTHRERILSSDITSLQVGATLPVCVSPSSPQKLLIDWDALD